MKVFGLVGWSGSGKTTLAVALINHLVGRGYTVSTIKHTHHGVELDNPGKDSDRHRVAGATDVVLSSPRGWKLIHELRDEPEPTPLDLIGRITPVDLLLVEGFKKHPHPKLEVYRPSVGKPVLFAEDPNVVAIATDAPLSPLPVTKLDINDIEAIANFVIMHCELGRKDAHRIVSKPAARA
jgi:molybdopterin-guanine dinucleotide biosynthesis protein B